MLNDYLALGDAIVQRVRDQVPEFRTVQTIADLALVADMRQLAPSALVVYFGDEVSQTPEGEARSGQRQVVTQRWLVVVTVQNVRDQRGGATAQREAGPLMSQTMAALKGWDPGIAGVRPLRRGPGSPPPEFDAGYGYFPILFLARVME